MVKGPLTTSSSSSPSSCSVVDVVLGDVVEVVDVLESGEVVEVVDVGEVVEVVEPGSVVVGVEVCVVELEDSLVVEVFDGVVEVLVVSRLVSVVDEVEDGTETLVELAVGSEVAGASAPRVLEVAEMGRSVT